MSILINIIWPILGSSGLIGFVVYLLKKNFERKIEHRFKQIELNQKLNLEEVYRRQAKLFDDQYSNQKLLCGVTYRLKNTTSTLAYLVERSDNSVQIKSEMKILKSCESLLTETLYADKFIMEDDAFKIVHDLKHAVIRFIGIMQEYTMRGEGKYISELKPLSIKIENAHYEALATYKQSLDLNSQLLN